MFRIQEGHYDPNILSSTLSRIYHSLKLTYTDI